MPGHPRLYRRNATYYHRAAIPIDIKDSYPKAEETFSLKTKDYQEAIRLVRIAAAEVDRKFDQHRKKIALEEKPSVKELSDEQIKRIGDIYYAFLLEEDDEIRGDGFYEEEGPLPPLPVKSFEEFVEDREAHDENNRYNHARGKTEGFYLDEAEEVLSWSNVEIKLAKGSQSLPKLARALQAAAIKAGEAISSRNLGNIVETPKTLTPDNPTSAPFLSTAVEDWANEKARDSWVEKTEREHRVWMAHFIAITGDKPLNEYQKADGRAFKAILLKLPANWIKHKELKGLPIDKASMKADELGMEPMSSSNINKLIGFISAFWNWAENNYDDNLGNPLKGMKIKKRHDERDERHPFTTDELKAIFSAPIYTGCESIRHWKRKGDLIPRDSGKYWVPLIGLFTGCRLGEIIQLQTKDVRTEDGILHFVVDREDGDKRLKNSNAKRLTPVHPDLIRFGFMDLVNQRKKQNSVRLFPDLPKGQDGYYSSPFSKYFNGHFLPSIGVKRKKNAFHSFRHSFEDACRDSDINKELMDALQGHGEDGESKRYGKGYILRKRNEAMEKLSYRNLDLSHLYVD